MFTGIGTPVKAEPAVRVNRLVNYRRIDIFPEDYVE